MEFKEVIEKRRTIRDFKDQDIPDEIIKNAIENGFKAPSYNHLREWDFIIIRTSEAKSALVRAESLEREINIDDLAQKFRDEEHIKKEMYLDAIPKQKRMILTAPVVAIVIFKPKTVVEKARNVYDLNCLASVWCCIENFLLSIAEYNIYGVTYIPQNIEKIKTEMQIPKELEVAAIIPFGYKLETAKTIKQKQINISDRIHFEKYK